MSLCTPTQCYAINERIGIMEHDAGLANPIPASVKDTCQKCPLRGDKTGLQIMRELKGEK